jgi:hypothetical protein
MRKRDPSLCRISKPVRLVEIEMKLAKAISLFCVFLMAIAMIYGFTAGDFATDGARLLSNPWGIVSIVDLYVGFILFSGWIIFREKSWIKTIIWVALMMVLGFFTGALYTYLALARSGGDWRQFWMGARADKGRSGS